MRLNKPTKHVGHPMVRRGIARTAISLVAASISLVLAACAPPPNPVTEQQPSNTEFDVSQVHPVAAISPEEISPREVRACPDLDSQLFQLTQAADPLQAAEQLGLRVQGGKVQVLLVLISEDSDFLKTYGVEIGTQVGTQVQAFAPIDQLCDLATTDSILAIRPVAYAGPRQ